MVQDCGLIDLDLSDYQFTWERGCGREIWVEIRLDRALVSSSWLSVFPNALLTNSEVSTSDHCPIWLEPSPRQRPQKKCSFKFENAWLREPMCKLIVEQVSDDLQSASMFQKLEACAQALRVWGKDVTGNFYERIGRCFQIIRAVKGLTDAYSLQRYQAARNEFFEALTEKEIFWRQRAKQLWLREGDHNSKYFHATARSRRRSNRIVSLCNSDGVMVDWDHGLQEVMIDYFQALFIPSAIDWGPVVDQLSPRILSSHNDMLLRPVEDEEVKEALFQMNSNKSPGPDGMSPRFYQKFWATVGGDVISQVRTF